jgi:DNA-binding CsgD family transcriptional regulator
MWLVLDLTEAAVRTGRSAQAAAHVAAAVDADIAGISSRLRLLTFGAAAIAAPPAEASSRFDAALGVPGSERWPFDRARIQLAYGECLRRTRRSAAARPHLAAAADTFRRLGAQPWLDQAGRELRATGRTRQPARRTESVTLTPQQRQIAELAATGLTNKEIGERLFLSPRTIATHLYELFPKLGITSRAGLRDALGAVVPTATDVVPHELPAD